MNTDTLRRIASKLPVHVLGFPILLCGAALAVGCAGDPAAPSGEVGSAAEAHADAKIDAEAADASACLPRACLPASVPNRIGRAQEEVEHVVNRTIMQGTRDYVWSDDPRQPAVSGTYSSAYLPNDRLYQNSAVTLKWNANAALIDQSGSWSGWAITSEPAWVVYTSDDETPAYEFSYSCSASDGAPCQSGIDYYAAPVDIASTAVRGYVYCQSIAPYLMSASPLCPGVTPEEPGRFNAISLDNVAAVNLFDREWIDGQHRYTGQLVDSDYAADVASWMTWLTCRGHDDGICTTANVHYHNADLSDYFVVATTVDNVLDEDGFVRDANYGTQGPCQPVFEYTNAGTSCPLGGSIPAMSPAECAWTQRIASLQQLAQAAGHGLVLVDKSCQDASGVSLTSLNMTLSQYLLISSSSTYLAIAANDNAGDFINYPQLYLPVGEAQGSMQTNGAWYSRQFDNYLAIVNPSATAATQYTLASGTWYDLGGNSYSGTIPLPAQSGLVLTQAYWRASNAAPVPPEAHSSTLPPVPGAPPAPAFDLRESTADGNHEANLYLVGDPTQSWSVRVQFESLSYSNPATASRNLKIALSNVQDETKLISVICMSSSASTAKPSQSPNIPTVGEVQLTDQKGKSYPNLYECTLRGVPSGVGTRLRLTLLTTDGDSTSYQGDGASGLHIDQVTIERSN